VFSGFSGFDPSFYEEFLILNQQGIEPLVKCSNNLEVMLLNFSRFILYLKKDSN